MNNVIDLKNKTVITKPRCVICAAGPFSNADTLKAYVEETDCILAADNGVRLVQAMGLTPHRIVSDMDSMGALPQGLRGIPLDHLPTVKDDTDTLAAAKWALQEGYRDFLLLGATGGRLDHTMANFAVLLYLTNRGASAALADEYNVVTLVKPGAYRIRYAEDHALSFLPYGGEVHGLTIENAAYPLNNASLTPDYPLGVSNAFVQGDVEISLSHGNLLIFLSKD